MPDRRRGAGQGAPPKNTTNCNPNNVAVPAGYGEDISFSVSGLTPAEQRAYLAGKRRLPDVPWETARLTPEQRDCQELMRQDDPHGILNTDGWRRAGGIVVGRRAREYFGTRRSAAEALIGEGHAHLTRTYAQEWTPPSRLPFHVEELQAAMDNKRHRTAEQRLIIDVFCVYLAEHKPPSRTIAAALGRGERTIKDYRAKGAKLLTEIIAAEVRAAVADAMHQEREEHLRALLAALGIDPVSEAERVLVEEMAA